MKTLAACQAAPRWTDAATGWALVLVALMALLVVGLAGRRALAAENEPGPAARIRVDLGHPWRPPFGLDRVGRPLEVAVELADERLAGAEIALLAVLDGQELSRQRIAPAGEPPSARVRLEVWPTELVLLANSGDAEPAEIARQAVDPPQFEAEAIARPDAPLNPVDLGAILVRSGWLLVKGGQRGSIDVAAISRLGDFPAARAAAGFESAPQETTGVEIPLARNRRAEVAGRPLDPGHYAWDGHTLWLDMTVSDPTTVRLDLAGGSERAVPSRQKP